MTKYLPIILITLSVLVLNFPIKVSSQNSSPSATPLDEITENVKKRIQEVVKDKSLGLTVKDIAYMGTLQSLTNNTLSILTENGVHLASTSANTIFIRTPGLKSITSDDLAIDSYAVVIGVPASGQVLDALEVISQDITPSSPADKSFYGNIVTYDPKNYFLTLQNPSTQEQKTTLISRKANFNQWVLDGTKDPLKRTQLLAAGTPALIIYTPAGAPDGTDLAIDVLLSPSNLKPVTTPSP